MILKILLCGVCNGSYSMIKRAEVNNSRKYFTDNVLPNIKEKIDTKLVQLLKDVEF